MIKHVNPAHTSPEYVLPSAVAVFWVACGVAVSVFLPAQALLEISMFDAMGDLLSAVVPQIRQLADASLHPEKVTALFNVLVLASPLMIFHFWTIRSHLFSLLATSISPVAGLVVCLAALSAFVWLVAKAPLPTVECGAKAIGRRVPILCKMRLSSAWLGFMGTMVVFFINLTLTASLVFVEKLRRPKSS